MNESTTHERILLPLFLCLYRSISHVHVSAWINYSCCAVRSVQFLSMTRICHCVEGNIAASWPVCMFLVCVHTFLMLPMLVDSSSATTNQMRFKHLFFSDITSRRGEVGERDSGQLSGRLLQITGKLFTSICVCIVSQIGKFWNFEKLFPTEVFQSNASKGTDMQMFHFLTLCVCIVETMICCVRQSIQLST